MKSADEHARAWSGQSEAAGFLKVHLLETTREREECDAVFETIWNAVLGAERLKRVGQERRNLLLHGVFGLEETRSI